MINKKKIVSALLVTALTGALLIGSERKFEKPGYMVAAHYFADEWPINFWNAEWDNLNEDLEQIREDGFNTVIIVVPWREFQPEIEPMVYNEYVFTKLEEFMRASKKADLMVQVRLGYLNDFYGEDNSAQRFYEILSDENIRSAWFDYAETVYQTCSKYDNFGGGFMTWEDFWHNYMLQDYVGGTEEGLAFSVNDGFPEYLSEKYTIEEFNKTYQTDFGDFHEIGVPVKSDLYAEEWFYFVDEFTIELLAETRNYFPDLFMEVRTDDDWMGTHSGDWGIVSHKDTWDCADGEFTTIMYKPAQGVGDNGEKISSQAVLKNLDRWLDNIYQNNGQKPIYIDQFLFVDNTPGYTGGDIIQDNQMEEYLIGCSDVFEKYTNGYGVWVYKDYRNNMLFNPQFALETEGWECEGDIRCVKQDGSNKLFLGKGSTVIQVVPFWRILSGTQESTAHFSLEYNAKEKTELSVMVGKQRKTSVIDGKGTIDLEFITENEMTVQIYSNADIVIDNIKLYNFIQSQRLYDVDGNEMEYVENIRELNRALSNIG